MRLKVSKSKNASSLYVIKDINVEGKRTTKIVESLGTYDELIVKLNGQDYYAWANDYINELNKLEKIRSFPLLSKVIQINKSLKIESIHLMVVTFSFKVFIINLN